MSRAVAHIRLVFLVAAVFIASVLALVSTNQMWRVRRDAIPEARLLAAFHQTATGVVVADLHGAIMSANEHFATLVGWPQDLLPGMRIDQLMPVELAQSHSDRMERYLEAKRRPRVISTKCQVERRDGTKVAISVRIYIGESWACAIVDPDCVESELVFSP